MARAPHTDVLTDRAGNVVQGALGTLYTDEAGSVAATDAFAALSGGSPITTVTTDANGRWYTYWTTPKEYWIRWSDNSDTAHYPGVSSVLSWTAFMSERYLAVEPPADEETDDTTLATVVTGLADHLADTVDAHDGSAISYAGAPASAARPTGSTVEAALDTLTDYTVADITARNALVGMVNGAFCWVTNIDRVYRYNGSAWKPITDVDYINVLDYGAHHSLTDNSTAINAAINDRVSGSGTRQSDTVLFPVPTNATVDQGYEVRNPILVREVGFLRLVATAGNDVRSGGPRSNVKIYNTFNSNAVLDGDDYALPNASGNNTVVIEGLNLYQAAATAVYLRHAYQWQFRHCNITTGADTPAMLMTDECFWVTVYDCGLTNSGTTTGIVKATGSANRNNYLLRFEHSIFTGGPCLEIVSDGGTGTSGLILFDQCDGESQTPSAGMFVRITRTSGTIEPVGITLRDSFTFDPVAAAPFDIIRCTNTNVSLQQVIIDNAGSGAAGLLRVRMAGGNLQGLWVRGSLVHVVDDAGTAPYSGTYGFALDGLNGRRMIGSAPANPAAAGLDVTTDVANGLQFAVQGNTHASLLIGYDGSLQWASGSSATADTDLFRTAAGILKTSGRLRLGLGSAASPALQFGSDADSGFYESSDNNLHLATAGVNRIQWGGSGMVFNDYNLFFSGSTGSQLGTTTTEKFAFWGATPVVRPSAYTQTYSTANKTLSAYTADDESAAYTGAADGEAKLVDLNALRVAYENLRAFAEDLAQFTNSIVDDLQTVGLVG